MRKIVLFTAKALLCLKKSGSAWQALKYKSNTLKTSAINLGILSKFTGKELERLKRKGLYFTFLMLLLSTCSLRAQENKKDKRLIIGDKIPNVVLAKIINFKDSTIQFSALRGRAVILDFWATFCTACLKEFPKMNGFQRQYGKNLQIMLVNAYSHDTEKVLADFLVGQRAKSKDFSLPIVRSDTTLRKIFPITSMPHYIWVGADGRIKAITRADQVTSTNIERLIAGLTLNLKPKRD